MIKKVNRPGRPSSDGATSVQRVNISLTADHRDKLKKLAGLAGASSWIRQAIDKSWSERK